MASHAGINEIKSVFQDSRGDVWVGTKIFGLQRLVDGRWETVRLPGSQSSNEVTCIFEDASGSVWVGTRGELYRRSGDEFLAQRPGAEIIRGTRAMVEESSGGLWIGTYRDGLYGLKDGKLTHYTSKDGIAEDCAWTLHLDSEGQLWIGTTRGLTRFKNGQMRTLTVKQGLFDDIVNSIVEDRFGDFWISCNLGIYRASRHDLNQAADGIKPRIEHVVYGMSDGMLDNETNGGHQPSAIRARDGMLWFPTMKGVVRMDPSRMWRNSLPPQMAIEEVVADGESLDPRLPARLAAGRGGVLRIHFTATSFVAPEKVRFRYCLDGCDRDWSEPTASRTSYYTNLKPGDYKFQVVACNNHGVWTHQPATFSFRIVPYFHQTYWFYALCAVSVFAVGYGVHRFRMDVSARMQQLEHQHAFKVQGWSVSGRGSHRKCTMILGPA